VNQPQSAAATPGATGSVSVDVGSTTTSSATATGAMPVSVALSWPSDAFQTAVTVSVTPKPLPTPPAGALEPPPATVAGGFTVGNTVVQVNVTTASGDAVTEFSAPLVIHISSLGTDQVPAYSHDGITWTLIPQLTTPSLPDAQADGYFINSDGSVDIYTRHATLFGLLLDTQPPTTPIVAARLTGTKLRLTIKAKDNVRVTSYRLIVNGHLIKRTTHPYLVLDARPAQFQIVAVDEAGNLSPLSMPVVVGWTSTTRHRLTITR
jgi:hypothetical protein